MSLLQRSNSKAPARQQIAIDGVEDSVLKMPGGHFAVVLKTSSINMALKSEAEKDAIISTYINFLNSLPCTLEILIRIREMDIDNYLDDYKALAAAETEEVYRESLVSYIDFVRQLVETNKILTRDFYIIIPFENVKNHGFERVKEQLSIYTAIVKDRLEKLGMHCDQLDSLELLDLFYTFYNPEQAKLQPLTAKAMQMLTTQYI
jgi:hypothetical protein